MMQKHNHSQSFNSQLNAYSDSTKNTVKTAPRLTNSAGYFAGAAAVLAMGTTEAEAVIRIVDVNHVMNPASNLTAAFALDIDGVGHATNDFLFQATLDESSIGDRDWFRMGGTTNNLVVGSVYSSAFNYVSRLGLGATVSTALGFVDGDSTSDSYLASSQHPTYAASGQWLGGNTGFIGFKITDGADTRLGWIEIRVDADNGGGEIVRYGIETDPNVTSITINNVPEPSSLACLAMGAAGLLGWRQRRDIKV